VPGAKMSRQEPWLLLLLLLLRASELLLLPTVMAAPSRCGL
jgi:hypothetical protein